MQEIQLGKLFLKELEAESRATRTCIERIPHSLYAWKPHEKSMDLGYLTLLVAEIPKWIADTIVTGEIDLATYGHFQLSDTAALVAHFDENMVAARQALEKVTNDDMTKTFSLKSNGHTLFSASVKQNIGSSINHLVHHRGQLTVYMRLNNIPVPSIYGPSADDRSF